MTKQEIIITYDKNIIQLQDLIIKKLSKGNPFLDCSNTRKKELNKENIKCLKAVLKVLNKNYKKDLKDCENEPTEELMSAEKVEELVNEKVNQTDF